MLKMCSTTQYFLLFSMISISMDEMSNKNLYILIVNITFNIYDELNARRVRGGWKKVCWTFFPLIANSIELEQFTLFDWILFPFIELHNKWPINRLIFLSILNQIWIHPTNTKEIIMYFVSPKWIQRQKLIENSNFSNYLHFCGENNIRRAMITNFWYTLNYFLCGNSKI